MPRSLVYYVAISIDGFIAQPDGSFGYFLFEGEHFPDLFRRYPETFPAHLRQALGISGDPQLFDTVLMGRATYEVGVREGILSPYSPLRQIVVSTSMKESPDPSVELWRDDPLPLVRSLKAQPGKAIWLCGGAKLAASLAGELDEIILKINPIVIGRGIPLFGEAISPQRLRLAGHTAYPNGFVLAHYTR